MPEPKTTNYTDTFIEVAEDSPAKKAEIPPQKTEKTVAARQFDMLYDHPYQYTSDDVIFAVHAEKNNIAKKDFTSARREFFSKGQACFRSSPLAKRYGWGVHSDAHGKIAIYPLESAEYKKLAKDKSLQHVKAMRSKRG
ncbi:DUF6157 family protein [Chryseolinea lacunae]|uniref:Uncharacterized protein n=1 Tax=Chryseolinea lacunae TaxID=2801331 RepID=A0ABS1KMD5_9BACT|nr:DUF6157 family protein [Chryseolinea lacunae]MBL0740412.1 hypothetical protein [Chryseolinea lacunae]